MTRNAGYCESDLKAPYHKLSILFHMSQILVRTSCPKLSRTALLDLQQMPEYSFSLTNHSHDTS
ncbi:hypothetical protein SERLA73DRAFT_148198, partial [Serpula lacrymans var. lacrymans S7.3]